MTSHFLILLGMPSAALVIVVVAQLITMFVTTYIGVQQQLQAQILFGIPAVLCILYGFIGLIRGRLNKDDTDLVRDEASAVDSQLKHIWGPLLNALETMIDLGERRIQQAQQRLEDEKQGETTSLYEVVRTGYKCIQVARGILILCRNGYPDQAYILCRTLVEQRVNLGFILTSGKVEEVSERYLDWEKVKFYKFIKRTKERRDKMNRGPTIREWADLTNEYQWIKTKYAGGVGDIDEKEEWAIAYRDRPTSGCSTIKRRSGRTASQCSYARRWSQSKLHIPCRVPVPCQPRSSGAPVALQPHRKNFELCGL